VDLGAGAIHPTIPGSAFPAQSLEVRDSPGAEALPREHADFDFGLIEPTSVNGRVVNGESVPDLAADLLAKEIGQGLAVVDV
jgi:hypothetical protein